MTKKQITKIQSMIATRGIVQTSKDLCIHSSVLMRILAGQKVRAGSAALVSQKLEESSNG